MYYVELEKSHLDYLAPIRHWDNLKLAFEGERVFIKDFTAVQINDTVLLQIPHIIVYELKEQLLFRKDKLVPSKKLPSALLWMPILNALPIDLPNYNMNYFGIHDKIDIKIVKSNVEQEAFGLITKIEEIKEYIEALPKVRLQNLKWIIIEDSILFLGMPLLPIQGQTYWLKDNCLFPTGYALEFEILFPIIKKELNPNNDCMLLFQSNSTYVSFPINECKPLNLSSFRLTIND